MTTRFLGILGALAGLAFACGEPAPEDLEASPAEQVATPIAGRYEVRGVTVAKESGFKREIAGTVILAAEGPRYTATFHLETTYPDPEASDPLAAEVIGHGEGTIEGRTLRGTAATQLVAATIPNVDPGFAFIPRNVSTRIVSTTVTTIATDGTVNIEIENQPAPGETYTPTRTTLTGRRVGGGEDADDEAAPEP